MSDVINGVPRELLERLFDAFDNDASNPDGPLDELRALLTAQPQASALSCVCVEPELPGIHRNDAPCDSNLPQASAAQSAPDEREADIRLMVDRFLSWPIPETLKADNCATMPGYPHRTGTNLMNADEAKQMLEHVISGANRYAEIESVDLGMKLPCEVKLPGGMTIGKGCTLSTLLLAMRSRSDDEPWRQRFGVPVPFDPSLINLANSIKTQAKPNEQAEREAFEALRDCKGFDYFDGAYWLRAITEVPDEKALVNADWELWQAATAWQRTQSAGVPEGWRLVPEEPTEEMWGGLARHLMMWLDFDNPTVEALRKHLDMLNIEWPAWMDAESELRGSGVPSKGTRATLIYKAMLAACKGPDHE